jgi:hypothetical protein
MKKNWLLWGAVAVGAYLVYKKMKSANSNPTGRDLAPPPSPATKPAPATSTNSTSNNDLI